MDIIKTFRIVKLWAKMFNTQTIKIIGLVFLISLGLFILIPPIIDLIEAFQNDIDKTSLLFYNISTPFLTAGAFIVYYLSLQQMKKQNKTLIAEKNYLRGQNIYNEISNIIENKKVKIESNKNLPGNTSIFSILNSDKIKELTESIVKNHYYKDCFIPKNVNEKNYIGVRLNAIPEYKTLNDIYSFIQYFLWSVNSIKNRIETHEFLDKPQKERLFIKLADTLLYEYFSFLRTFSNRDLNIKIPVNIDGSCVECFDIFDIYTIKSLYYYYERHYPNMINETMALHLEPKNKPAEYWIL